VTRVTKSGEAPATWLFDFDGTLVDSVELILDSLRHTTRTVLGRVVPDDVLRARVGRPLAEHMRELDAERADDLVAVYREHNMRRHADLLRPYPGVAAMLAGLRGRRARVGIVTSKMRPAVDAGMALVPLGEFDAIVTCEDTDRHKPDPAPVLRGLELLDADPGTTATPSASRRRRNSVSPPPNDFPEWATTATPVTNALRSGRATSLERRPDLRRPARCHHARCQHGRGRWCRCRHHRDVVRRR